MSRKHVMSQPLVSVVLTSYNYARYLRESIDSALGQTYPGVEVIVVDDGSADASCEIIRSYRDRITAIGQENGGQASAWNAGAALARGAWVIFLDSDDRLAPHAAHAVVSAAGRGRPVSKVHWPMRLIGEHGERLGVEIPGSPLPSGSRAGELIEFGFDRGPNLPSSGNAWSAGFLWEVLPMPEAGFRISADTFLLGLSPLFGETAAIRGCCSEYRCHPGNNGALGTPKDRAADIVQRSCLVFDRVSAELARRQCPADPRRWTQTNPEFVRNRRIAEGRAHA
jgi:glycosyltransferase involved in cell wall biosynthesis